MIKQIPSNEIESYTKNNTNLVLLDVRTEEEWNVDGKPDGEKFGLKTYFLTIQFADGTFNEKVIPCLEFTIEIQSNQLIYQKEYTKRQQIIYLLIHHLHDRERWSYKKISNWLNKSSILTHTGKNWFSSSVISVLKRKHERDLMNEQIRNQHFPSKVSKFEVNYYIFD